jgi:selenocysteine-specific elongation factor
VTVVVGTAGHIDHGKTTLLRALTGIDADRLPEERRRGMTIDVGYAHMPLADGTELDFVDVPGHDRLVGNMLVGAGEIDAVLLVVAADDGLRAQTIEHLELLDALEIAQGIVAVTKTDAVEAERVGVVIAEVIERLARTSLASAPVIAVSGTTGAGLDALRLALGGLRDRVQAERAARPARPPSLAVDRVFSVKGRGVVVTGTLRGGPLEQGATLRVVPGEGTVRVRELQVHGRTTGAVTGGGRTALNLAGAGLGALRRGAVLTADPAVVATDRLLVELASPGVRDRARLRCHIGTDAAEAVVGRSGREDLLLPGGSVGAILRLETPVAAAVGDRFVLRRATPAAINGGIVLDPVPARGVSRRRQTAARVAALAAAVHAGDAAAVLDASVELHGILAARLAPDVMDAARGAALATVTEHHAVSPADAGPSSGIVRTAVARSLRRAATLSREDAAVIAGRVVDELVRGGELVRDGDRLRAPQHRPVPDDPDLEPAMARLELALAVAAPPPLGAAAAAAGCPPGGIRDLERSGRIAVLDGDLAYAMTTYRTLAATALELAAARPLSPAAFRDATGTSRRYVMPILEDLDRRGILRRTPDGHVPGPRAPAAAARRAR